MDDPQNEPPVPTGAKPHSSPNDCQKDGAITDLNECLKALSKLPGLVLMKVVTPAQSNAMCKVYLTLLQHHWRSVGEGPVRVAAKQKLVELLRQHPEMTEVFAEFLDETDIAAIVKGKQEPGDGPQGVL